MGIYGQGWNLNTVSFGVPLLLGIEFNFGRIISLALLGEVGVGLGWPYLLEGNAGGMAELYFANKMIGLGAGGGLHGRTMPLTASDPDTPDSDSTTYLRFALIFRKDSKFNLYAKYHSDSRWGFGLQWCWNIFNKW